MSCRIARLCVVAVITALLAACGNKGPLVRPGASASAAALAAAPPPPR